MMYHAMRPKEVVRIDNGDTFISSHVQFVAGEDRVILHVAIPLNGRKDRVIIRVGEERYQIISVHEGEVHRSYDLLFEVPPSAIISWRKVGSLGQRGNNANCIG